MQRLTPVIPALWEAKAGRSPEVSSLRPAWPTWWNLISSKNTNISWAWCQEPVIPATQEAETQEWLEPGRWRLQWAEIVPLHSSETLSQNKKQTKKHQLLFRAVWSDLLNFKFKRTHTTSLLNIYPRETHALYAIGEQMEPKISTYRMVKLWYPIT